MLERRTFLAGLAALPGTTPSSDPVLSAIAAHRAAYDAWDAAKADATTEPDDPSDGRLATADARLDELAAMVPQSITELSAYIRYFAAYAERDEDSTTQHPALASMAAACRKLIGGEA